MQVCIISITLCCRVSIDRHLLVTLHVSESYFLCLCCVLYYIHVVPTTVDHAIIMVDPTTDRSWQTDTKGIQTDGVHQGCNLRQENEETWSEAIKLLKPR